MSTMHDIENAQRIVSSGLEYFTGDERAFLQEFREFAGIRRPVGSIDELQKILAAKLGRMRKSGRQAYLSSLSRRISDYKIPDPTDHDAPGIPPSCPSSAPEEGLGRERMISELAHYMARRDTKPGEEYDTIRRRKEAGLRRNRTSRIEEMYTKHILNAPEEGLPVQQPLGF